MTIKSIFDKAINDHLSVVNKIIELYPDIEYLALLIRTCLGNGGKVLWAGNGGSAADSQHLAAEIVGRFKRERKGLASVALTTDTSIITSVGNDYGFDHIYSRQVEAIGNANDIFIGISTSGNSKNIVAAVNKSKAMGLVTVGLLGNSGGQMQTLCDHAIVVPASDTARIQEVHILIGHILCELLEANNI